MAGQFDFRSVGALVWPLACLLALAGVACGDSTTGPGDLCPAGISCDDQNECTVDSCDPEVGCVHDDSGAAGVCDDGNPCTADACDPAGGCVNDGTEVTDACDDANACTSGDACQGDAEGSCQGVDTSAVDCDDGNSCTADSCHPVSGCINDGFGNLDPCDDGSVCTENDTCQGDSSGTCAGKDTSDCEDDDPCTEDSCDPLDGCQHDSLGVTAPCDDGDPCTAFDQCMGDADGTCAGTAPTDCDDNSPCTVDSCDSAVGCVNDGTGITVACDDRNVCTHDDVCRGDAVGTCLGTFQPNSDCDDDNICTVDTCDAQLGCVHDGSGIAVACDDGDACTTGEICRGDDAGTCEGGAAVDCDDGSPCTLDGCDPATGCTHDGSGITATCDDASICTDNDVCQGDPSGTCAGTDMTAVMCDDGNACTTDTCDPVEACSNEIMADHDCFPVFEITYPPRGATILGSVADPQITVTGRVYSGGGAISSFTLNGVSVPLAADGSFSQPVLTDVAGNVLLFEATDAMGSYRKRVQAFLWSSTYFKPDKLVPKSGMVSEGMAIWLSQEVVDDGDHSLPPDDLATIFEMVLSGFDLSSFFDSGTPIAQQAGYDIFLTDLWYGTSSASLQAINGGLGISAGFYSIGGDLVFDCPCGFPCGCWWTGGDSTGGLSIDSLTITADILLSVNPDHTLAVTVANPVTSINNLDVWSNDIWTNILLSIVETFIRDSLVADLEAELNSQLTNVLAPLLADALGALAFNQSFDLPRLDGAGVITVDLVTDFHAVPFDSSGGTFVTRAGAYADKAVTYDNLGVPGRIGCGSPPQSIVVTGTHPLELTLADDTLNELFYAAWSGGLLDFPIPPELIGDVDLSQYGIENLQLNLSGMLAPTATDCNPTGELKIFMGDLRLHAYLELAGTPLDIIVWASATMGLELTAANGEIAITITAIDAMETELTVVQDEGVGLIELLGVGFEQLLLDAIMQALNGGQLATIPLPEIDLSDGVGLPPGSAVIAIDPSDVVRIDGNTIIGGDLR